MSNSNLEQVFNSHKGAVYALKLEAGFNQTRAIILGRCWNDSDLNDAARDQIIESTKIHASHEKNGGPLTRLLEAISK